MFTALSLILAAAGSAVASPFTTEATVRTLDNGLVVVLEENHRTDEIALHVRYRVGSADELDGERGCAHLFEHLMFEGSANVPANAFDNWLTAAGGQNNAFTDRDQTAYHMTFPSGALDLALFLESDRLGFLEAGLDQANLENQQSVVLQERAEGYDEPHGRDIDALTRLQFPSVSPTGPHPYNVPVIGTVADIEGFQLDAVVDFWRRHYRPDNAVLVLVGNFDSAEALARIEHWMDDVPTREADFERPIHSAERTFRAVNGMIEDSLEDRTLYISWPTVPVGHPDEPALDVLSYLLEGGRGTRMDDKLYYKSKLATDDGVFSWTSDIDGQFVAYATSPDTSLKKLDKHMRKVIEGVAKKPPTDDEILRGKRSIRSWVLDSLEYPEDRAQLLADCYHQMGDPNCLSAEWDRYDAVTSADVVRVVETYLSGDNAVTLSVVPRGDDGALEGAIAVELP